MEHSAEITSELTKATVRLTVKNISKLFNRIQTSEAVVVRGIPWVVFVTPVEDKVHRFTGLGVFLQCSKKKIPPSWSYKVQMEMKLFAQKEGCEDFKTGSTTSEFTSTAFEWGYNKFLPWSTLVTSDNGYILEDSIILEVEFKVDPPIVESCQWMNSSNGNKSTTLKNELIEDSSVSLVADLCSKVTLSEGKPTQNSLYKKLQESIQSARSNEIQIVETNALLTLLENGKLEIQKEKELKRELEQLKSFYEDALAKVSKFCDRRLGMSPQVGDLYKIPLALNIEKEIPEDTPHGNFNQTSPYHVTRRPVYSFYATSNGNKKPVCFPPDAFEGFGIPYTSREIHTFDHGEIVCALAMSHPSKFLYTGGQGSVKIWNISSQTKEPHYNLDVSQYLPKSAYIRALKLLPDGQSMIVAGEGETISIWDLAGSVPRISGQLKSTAPAVFGLAVSADSKICFGSSSDGKLRLWDLRTLAMLKEINAHGEGISCLDISHNGNTLYTGGLDNVVKAWDMRQGQELEKYEFSCQIYAIGCHPIRDWITVGLENGNVETFQGSNQDKYSLILHDHCVMSLKYASTGKWFITAGKDQHWSCCRAPYGAQLFETKGSSTLLSCDISMDGQYVVTGSSDKKATVYEIEY